MAPDIVFDQSRLEYLADLVNVDVAADGTLRAPDTGDPITDARGEPLTLDSLGLVAYTDDGPEFIRDDVGALLDHVTADTE